jgi:phospholipase/lecithinase/hemolysin
MRAKAFSLPLVLFAASHLYASGLPINQIVSFGDSLSDNGNAYIATGGLYPGLNYAMTPYGYYTDGPNTTPSSGSGPVGLWESQLAGLIGVPNPQPVLAGGTNYAVASAQTGTTNAQDMGNQVAGFVATHPTGASSSALYTFWGGANDLFSGSATPQQAANNIMTEIEAVGGLGGKYFEWLNLPNLGDTPLGLATFPSVLNTETAEFNAQWQTDILVLDNLGLDVIGVNANALFSEILANPSQYLFTNADMPCQFNAVCTDPNQYVFWDDEHPTTAADKYVAELAASDLEANLAPVPESPTYAMLLLGGFGLWALARMQREAKITDTNLRHAAK